MTTKNSGLACDEAQEDVPQKTSSCAEDSVVIPFPQPLSALRQLKQDFPHWKWLTDEYIEAAERLEASQARAIAFLFPELEGRQGMVWGPFLMATMDWNYSEVHQLIRDNIRVLCSRFFPHGKLINGHVWAVSNVAGDPGESLKIELNDPVRAGMFKDFATHHEGTFLDLLMLSLNRSLDQAIMEICATLGIPYQSLLISGGVNPANQYKKKRRDGSGRRCCDRFRPVPAAASESGSRISSLERVFTGILSMGG